MPASMLRHQRFSSVLYGLAFVAGTGTPRAAAHSICSSRLMRCSRTGAMISRSGASARVLTSKRTWSLPLPVQPWAMAEAPSSRATSTSILAISGRPMAVASRYWPSYTAPDISARKAK